MPSLFSAFGRTFAPSWPMTVLTAVLLMLFVGLGRWQWERGAAKQQVWAEFENAAGAVDANARSFDEIPRYGRVMVVGRFDSRHQFLLDNRSHAGRPGYEVLTPFVLADGRRVLVNRGWVRFTGFRDRLPEVTVSGEERSISARLDELPSGGLASGRAPPDTGAAWPKVTSFPTHEQLESALGERLERRQLLLDPQLPDGYVREWSPPGMPPSRHFSYAIQWWGFALVLLVLYFGLNFRKVS